MKNAFFVFFTLIATFSGITQPDRFIDDRTGLPIIFVSEPDMFPSSWLVAPINQTSKPVDTSEIKRSQRIILNALSKYPVRVLRTYLKRVYVTSELKAYQTFMGGTRSADRVYVNNAGIKMGYTDEVVEQIFHAEFSSVLMMNSDTVFDSEKWNMFNDTSFEYRNDEFEALRKGRADQYFDTVLHAKGFLHSYACTSLENDFNSFAQFIFLPPNEFIAAVKKYPRLKQKVFFVIDFYSRIDSGYALMKFTYMF